MSDTKLQFTTNEQNLLAMICQAASRIHHIIHSRSEWPGPDDLDAFSRAVLSFPATSWGELYDKFHRQGLNRELTHGVEKPIEAKKPDEATKPMGGDGQPHTHPTHEDQQADWGRHEYPT